MKVQHQDFIATYSDVYPEGYCQHLIEEFDRFTDLGAGSNRQVSDKVDSHIKDDHQINLTISSHYPEPFNQQDSVDLFFKGLQRCYEEYTSKFSVLKTSKIRATIMKMQRTDPGGGYHIWHNEQGNQQAASRGLVYMLYANTLEPESAGETEFLYQKTRIRPVENTMILWPAAYTHTHRGNTVFGNTSKYIVTGWFYYD
jgi:hypothetical protein